MTGLQAEPTVSAALQDGGCNLRSRYGGIFYTRVLKLCACLLTIIVDVQRKITVHKYGIFSVLRFGC